MARPTPFALIMTLLTLALALPALSKPGRVVTKDGKTLEGDVTENPQLNQVNIVVDGQKYTFHRNNINRIDYAPDEPTPPPAAPPPGQQQPGGAMTADEQEFQKRRAATANNDVNGLLKLARWAMERQQYDLAYDAAQDARDADPRNREAQDLLRTIEAHRKLNRRATAQPQPQPGGSRPAPGAQPPADGQRPDVQPGAQPAARGGQDKGEPDNALVRPLSPDEVNRIRMLEWRGDRNVRIRLMNDVKRRYLARADIQPAEFNKLDAVEQAWEMKRKGSPELLNDIRMTNDPPALQEYRQFIQRAVLTTCATAACHGGGAGSDKFALHARADHEADAYANFLTLHNYEYKPEKGREAAMIDRNRPEDSLLIQFGLPPNVSNMPHPEVDGFRPLFKSTNDQRYRQFVRWIADSLSPLMDDYGVPFDDAPEGGGRERPAGGAEREQPHPPRDETGSGPASGPRSAAR